MWVQSPWNNRKRTRGTTVSKQRQLFGFRRRDYRGKNLKLHARSNWLRAFRKLGKCVRPCPLGPAMWRRGKVSYGQNHRFVFFCRIGYDILCYKDTAQLLTEDSGEEMTQRRSKSKSWVYNLVLQRGCVISQQTWRLITHQRIARNTKSNNFFGWFAWIFSFVKEVWVVVGILRCSTLSHQLVKEIWGKFVNY